MGLEIRVLSCFLVFLIVLVVVRFLVRQANSIGIARRLISHRPYPQALERLSTRFRLRLSRSGSLSMELPFAVELLGLAVSSGAGLMHAIGVVGRSDSTEAFSAFDMASRDFAAGLTKDQVLQRLGQRLCVPAAVSLVSAISRADHTGAPLAEVLSTQAEHARRQAYLRRNKSLELIPLWIVLCTVVFLLPAVILVAIVPHLFAFINTQW